VTTCSLDSGCFDSSDVILSGEKHGITQAPAQTNSVAANYFTTIGIGLMQGRGFESTDAPDSPKVAIVNQTFAQRFLPDGNPIGRHFSYPNTPNESFEIVGVVTDARVNNIREVAPPVIYFPIAQGPGNIDGLDIRTVADPRWIAAQIRQAVASVDPRLPIVDVSTLKDEVNENLTQQRLIARLTSIFGLLALGLACLGLYGVMSYIVQRRISEIGVRIAIGSPRPAVLWLVLKETLLLITAGSLIGIVISVFAMRLATSFLFGLSPGDPATIGGAALLLFFVSLAAGFLPARRAAFIDSMQALRSE
jgi:predicted permease